MKMIEGGAWCADTTVLSTAMLHFQNGEEDFTISEEDDIFHLYEGCMNYIWSVMPGIFRQHVIDATGYRFFHIVGHNYVPFDIPASWWNENRDKAIFVVKGELLSTFGEVEGDSDTQA